MELETKTICHDASTSQVKMPQSKKILHKPSEDWWVIYADMDMRPHPIFIIGSDAVCLTTCIKTCVRKPNYLKITLKRVIKM